MIEVNQLEKRFGALQVLRGLDLAMGRGRVTAIVGPNGAGKTTLIKIILGLTRADSGSVRIDRQPIDANDSYRSRIGYMPQIGRFPENLSALDLMALLRELRGAKGSVDEELIDRLRLADELRKPIRTLSGGTRQKVNAVLAFLFRPDILILDEPTVGLDPISSGIVKDKILAERGAGRTVVLTSHIMSDLEELADDVAFLADGRIGYAGTLFDLKR
ncbi:MAG TPA: ABC transporter ATP-binding protein, partial [Gemmatimonadaceae bacterium]|nr:ABC transporter ATP-binding protein [Gemmatimonadaceae bacterium]